MKHEIPPADPMVPLRAAAVELGVHPTTIIRYAQRNELQLRRIGPRKIGVRRSELERFKDAHRAHAGQS